MNYRKLDIDLLHTAYVLSQTRSFAAAAKLLSCSPSAVSHKIRKLEDRIGRELFVRTTRLVEPTHDGEILASDAARVLEAMDIIVRHFEEAPRSGEIKLGLSEEWLITPVSALIAKTSNLFPEISIILETAPCERLHTRIDEGSLDVAITLDFDDLTRSIGEPEPLVWVGHESLLSNEGPVPLVVNPPPCTHRKALLTALKHASIDFDITVNAGSLEAFRLAVAGGLGLGALPQSALCRRDGVTQIQERADLPQLDRGQYSVRLARLSRAPKLAWLKQCLEELVLTR